MDCGHSDWPAFRLGPNCAPLHPLLPKSQTQATSGKSLAKPNPELPPNTQSIAKNSDIQQTGRQQRHSTILVHLPQHMH